MKFFLKKRLQCDFGLCFLSKKQLKPNSLQYKKMHKNFRQILQFLHVQLWTRITLRALKSPSSISFHFRKFMAFFLLFPPIESLAFFSPAAFERWFGKSAYWHVHSFLFNSTRVSTRKIDIKLRRLVTNEYMLIPSHFFYFLKCSPVLNKKICILCADLLQISRKLMGRIRGADGVP